MTGKKREFALNRRYVNDIYVNWNGQAFEGGVRAINHWDNGITGNYWSKDYISTSPYIGLQ